MAASRRCQLVALGVAAKALAAAVKARLVLLLSVVMVCPVLGQLVDGSLV